jgi:hypothetical protein
LCGRGGEVAGPGAAAARLRTRRDDLGVVVVRQVVVAAARGNKGAHMWSA